MKPSHAESDNLVEQTHKIWQPRIGRNLSEEEARQIAENVTGFFAILTEWSRAARPASANDATVAAHIEDAEVCHDR